MNEFIWSDGIENALNKIHNNSLEICEYHNKNYSNIKKYQKYFRIPIIVLSGLNSVFSVGLQPFISQQIISVLCCSISLICGIISSIELFVGLQSRMEKEFVSSKEFYILSCDIFKTLSLERNNRTIDGVIYLDTIHSKYCSLIDHSELIDEENRKYRLSITLFTKDDKITQTNQYLYDNLKQKTDYDIYIDNNNIFEVSLDNEMNKVLKHQLKPKIQKIDKPIGIKELTETEKTEKEPPDKIIETV